MHSENPTETATVSHIQFPEDCIQLLSPSVITLEPQAFYDRIVAMYQPRVAGGKAREIDPKGKKIKAPTKKALGVYEIRNQTALGERVVRFTFDKQNLLQQKFIKPLCDHLLCHEKKLLYVLKKKNFFVSDCLVEGIELQEIIIVTDEKKETNHASSSD